MTGQSDIMRAARHLALPQIGESGQQRISEITVLMIGVCGIGCATATYLASSGVGRLMLNDFDTVDATNLGRQPLYTASNIGALKVDAAARSLAAINPDIRIDALPERLSGDALLDAVDLADVIVDGTDNFSTRFAVADACVEKNRCLVSGSAIRFEGQLSVFGPDYGVSPCYRCLYTEADETLDDCAGRGVLSPVPAVIGTLMAVETLKALAGIEPVVGRLTLYDGLAGDWRSVGISKREGCVCSRA